MAGCHHRNPMAYIHPSLKALNAVLVSCWYGAVAAPPPQPEPPPSLAAEGWYAGDLHVHRAPQEIAALMTQADLHVASVITWWNETNPWKSLPPPASPVSCDNGKRFYHLVAGEDERGGGALLYHNLATRSTSPAAPANGRRQ